MKRIFGVRRLDTAWLLFFAPLAASAPIRAQEVNPVPRQLAVSRPAEEPAAVAPVKIDDELRGLLDDRNVLLALVEFTEQARGEVRLRYSLADLRERVGEKSKRITAWYTKRGVPLDLAAQGWTFDAKAEAFVPPAARVPSAVEGPAKKP